MRDYHHLEVEQLDDAVVVQFRDHRLADEPVLTTLGPELYALASRTDYRSLVLDFTGVRFITSIFLGKLVAINKIRMEHGGTLTLCEMSPSTHQTFQLTKLDQILTITDTRAEALS